MPKRTFWLTTGLVFGATSTLWVERKVRRTLEQTAARLQPDSMAAQVGRSARSAASSGRDRLRAAVLTGRDQMLRREEELWAEVAERRNRAS